MLASPSLAILVSTTEALYASDTPSRGSAIGQCQAVGDHLQLIGRLIMLNRRWNPSLREITLIGGSVKPRQGVSDDKALVTVPVHGFRTVSIHLIFY